MRIYKLRDLHVLSSTWHIHYYVGIKVILHKITLNIFTCIINALKSIIKTTADYHSAFANDDETTSSKFICEDELIIFLTLCTSLSSSYPTVNCCSI